MQLRTDETPPNRYQYPAAHCVPGTRGTLAGPDPERTDRVASRLPPDRVWDEVRKLTFDDAATGLIVEPIDRS